MPSLQDIVTRIKLAPKGGPEKAVAALSEAMLELVDRLGKISGEAVDIARQPTEQDRQKLRGR